MPKVVDHEQRRRHIVEALLRVIGERGLEAVSLREVAATAGVSMGAVQHFFQSKDEMLLYAVEHWTAGQVHHQFTARVVRRLQKVDPARQPRTALLAIATESLPHDETTLAESTIGVALLSRAISNEKLGDALRPAFLGFVAVVEQLLTAADVADPAWEGQRFAALLDGLRQSVLVRALPYEDAVAMVDRHLDDVGVVDC